MRISALVAVLAGSMFIATNVSAQCIGHTKSVKIDSKTTTVQSSLPAKKPTEKKG